MLAISRWSKNSQPILLRLLTQHAHHHDYRNPPAASTGYPRNLRIIACARHSRLVARTFRPPASWGDSTGNLHHRKRAIITTMSGATSKVNKKANKNAYRRAKKKAQRSVRVPNAQRLHIEVHS